MSTEDQSTSDCFPVRRRCAEEVGRFHAFSCRFSQADSSRPGGLDASDHRHGKEELAPDTQLQKLLHLLGQRFPELTSQGFYNFRATSSGQVSQEVLRDANLLAMTGLVSIEVIEPGERGYLVTPNGLERARELEQRADSDAIQF